MLATPAVNDADPSAVLPSVNTTVPAPGISARNVTGCPNTGASALAVSVNFGVSALTTCVNVADAAGYVVSPEYVAVTVCEPAGSTAA